MTSPEVTKLVLFDLDNTLFDHAHSLRCAVTAVQRGHPRLAAYSIEDLVARYGSALERVYNRYLAKEITFQESQPIKVTLFFTELGLPAPSDDEVAAFRSVYLKAYRESRRATPGSLEALSRLREQGVRIAIVTNGQVEEQTAKTEAIGVRQLVDRIFTSEEVGCAKPDPRIFRFAVDEMLGNQSASPTPLMVGDSIPADIKGALDSGLRAVLYAPNAETSSMLLFDREVPVISHLGQLDAQIRHAT